MYNSSHKYVISETKCQVKKKTNANKPKQEIFRKIKHGKCLYI